MTSKLTFDL